MTEPTKSRRLRTPIDGPDARTQIADLRTAAGVPDGLTHDEAVRYLTHVHGRLDRVGRLAVLWEPHAAVGVTLAPDYQRGRADTYRDVISELRAALGWPDKT